MIDLVALRRRLEADMIAGLKANRNDVFSQVAWITATAAVVSFFVPWQWTLWALAVAALSGMVQVFCEWRRKQRFGLRLYALWMAANQATNAAGCSFALMLMTSSSTAAHVLGALIVIGTMNHAMMIGVPSIALSYACLVPPLITAWIMVFSTWPDHELWYVLALGLVMFGAHAFIITHNARSVMRARDAALRKADAATASKTNFMTAISHEIRTPLNGIMGIAQVNFESATTPDEKEQADILLSTSESLKQLLDDVLDQAKIEAGHMKLQPSNADVLSLIKQTLALFHANADAKGLELHVDYPHDLTELNLIVDKLRLRQIVSNLLSNAIKFTDEGSVRVTVGVRDIASDSVELEITVADTGRGMTKDEVAHVFHEFTQVDERQDRAAQGTGLGLAISSGLAKIMGGTLHVDSLRGSGSSFVLTLPCKRSDEQPIAARARIMQETPNLSGWRILVVDDATNNRRIVSLFLKDTQAQVTEAESGQAALDILSQSPCDVVLLDISMPGMDGPTVFDKIVTMHQLALRPKIVALTAHSADDARKSYLRMGMEGFLSKPLSKGALFEELARLGIKAPKPNPPKI